MKIIRGKDLDFIPVTHEDAKNSSVVKKVLIRNHDLSFYRIQMVNWAKLSAGKAESRHAHESMEEIYIILAGRARIRINSQDDMLHPGDAVIIPAGSSHEIMALGNSDVLFIAIGIV